MPTTNEIITPYDILEAAEEADREGWNQRHREILTLRRIVSLADLAADQPFVWRANKFGFFQPELTHAGIARLLGIPRASVTRYIGGIHIDENGCYDNLPNLDKH